MGSQRILVIGGGTSAALLAASMRLREAGFNIVEFGEACKRVGQTGLELADELTQISDAAYKLNPTTPVDKRPYYRRFEKRKR